MTAKTPPVPPENRSPKGPGSTPRPDTDTTVDSRADKGDPTQRGRHGNIDQNTHHQGYQQDR